MIGFLRGTVPTLTRRSTWVGRGALTASGELTSRILACGSTNRRPAAGSSAANPGLYVRMSRDARRRKAATALRGGDWADAPAAGARNRREERRHERPSFDRRAAAWSAALAADCGDY